MESFCGVFNTLDVRTMDVEEVVQMGRVAKSIIDLSEHCLLACVSVVGFVERFATDDPDFNVEWAKLMLYGVQSLVDCGELGGPSARTVAIWGGVCRHSTMVTGVRADKRTRTVAFGEQVLCHSGRRGSGLGGKRRHV